MAGKVALDRRRLLLIHPLGYDASKAGRDISRIANLMPPLGIASIAAYLEQHGFPTHLIDCFAHPDSDRTIDEWMASERPAYVGVSCTTTGFPDARRILKHLKQKNPGLTTIVGGPHISAMGEQVLQECPEIDIAIVGEGEQPLRALLEADGVPEGILGMVWRREGMPVFEGVQKDLVILDELPFPAYAKLAGFPHVYQLPIFSYPRTPSVSCLSSRGCPYQCSYCDRSVFRRSFRFNSAEYLYRHLSWLRSEFGIRHVIFYDDQFTFHRERIVEFCKMILDKPLGMTFNCAVRAEHVDRELLALMKRAGCWMISLGIETGDPDLLARHRQNPDLEVIAQVIRDIHSLGMRVKGLLMLGLPGETEETFQRTMDYVFSLPIDDVNLTKFTPFPGSPLYESIHESGTFEEDWESMDCMTTVFVPDGLTRERMEELFLAFYKRHFKQPRILWSYVTMLWKSPDSWRRFLLNLGSFLRFAFKPKRIGDGGGGA
ncbi:MAG: cobalamin-dependent protein [Lentisphaeria bacterium]|nr:cobalamin-dependent protein [Lentisphaeria bacterium]